MSTSRQYTPHYTIDDYVQWEGDWELWDGIAIDTVQDHLGDIKQL